MDLITDSDALNGDEGSRRSPLVEPVCVALAVLAFYWTHLDFTRMQTGGDFANLFWPLKEFRLRVLAEAGVVPLWNPYVFMGSPLAATMQHAVFYPIDYLFFWKSPTLAAMNLYVLAHNVLAGIGMWWWMRRGWGVSGLGAVYAGAVFPCTAWFWGAQEHINQVAAVAWMPWLLGTALLFARDACSWRRFVVQYTALGSLQFLAGHPQAAFYTHLAGFGIIVMSVILRCGAVWRIKERINRTGFKRNPLLLGMKPSRVPASVAPRCNGSWACAGYSLSAFAAAGLLTGLVCSVQLLPAMELSGLSYRQFQGTAYSMTYSMPPDVLVTAVRPHAFGSYLDGYSDQRAYNEYGFYAGLWTCALALLGSLYLHALRKNGLLLLFAGVMLLTLLLAMGGNISVPRILQGEFSEFPQPALGAGEVMQDVQVAEENPFRGVKGISLHEIFITLVPPAKGFRVPARIAILTTFLLVTLAGFGADMLRGIPQVVRVRVPFALAWFVLLVAAGTFADLFVHSGKEKFRHPKDTAPLLLEWERDRDLREGASIDDRLFRLTTGDLNLIVAERQRSAEAEWELRLGGNGPSQRWLRWQENNNVVAQLPSIEGYEEGLSPTVRTKDFLFEFNRNLRAYKPDEQFLALMGIGRIFADLPVDPELYPVSVEESRGIRRVHTVPASKGAAFWAAQAQGVDFARMEGPFYRGLSPNGTRQNAAVPIARARNWEKDWPHISTDVTDPNEVVLRTTGDVPGDAILAMGWAPGWTAAGEPVEWLGAVHARVPAAAFAAYKDGEAVLRYKPRSYRLGLFLTSIGLAVWCCLVTSGLARRGVRRFSSGA